ncbi:hypothetical protein TYRP_015461 [Tyrophagus putrescentiae]|nr:hypothetical protein TYRP_015461 [Tyrophagus putrescentiae]
MIRAQQSTRSYSMESAAAEQINLNSANSAAAAGHVRRAPPRCLISVGPHEQVKKEHDSKCCKYSNVCQM